jgi:hypothetical protein
LFGGLFDGPGPRDVLVAIDKGAFGDLPEDLGRVRGSVTAQDQAKIDAIASQPIEGFDAGAAAPEAQAVRDEIRAELEAPASGPDMADAEARAAARAERDALRGAGMDDLEIDLPDGTSAPLSRVLDDLDADDAFDAFIQACAITPAGGAQ